jgi:hypothetical protein
MSDKSVFEEVKELKEYIFNQPDKQLLFKGGFIHSSHKAAETIINSMNGIYKHDRNFFLTQSKVNLFNTYLHNLKKIETLLKESKNEKFEEIKNDYGIFRTFRIAE